VPDNWNNEGGVWGGVTGRCFWGVTRALLSSELMPRFANEFLFRVFQAIKIW